MPDRVRAMSNELTKSQNKRMRELAGIAYSRELSLASDALLGEFNQWKEERIDVFELNEKIHKFHNGISQTLYKRYVGMDSRFGVARALKTGILERSEIDEDLYPLISNMVEILSSSAFRDDSEA